jgi:hypothetical protein
MHINVMLTTSDASFIFLWSAHVFRYSQQEINAPMNSRKRGAVVLETRSAWDQDTACYLDIHSSCSDEQYQCSKRGCGTSKHSAVGAARQQEITAFLNRLNRHLPQDPEELQRATGFSSDGWQAFAELNDLLNQHFHTLNSVQLRGYHSFCTQDRNTLWLNYAAANGVTIPGAALVGHQHILPGHLQLVRFVLEHVFGTYPSASLIKFTMTVPLWAVGWTARWGWTKSEMSVVILQAYSPASQQPTCRLYIPAELCKSATCH